MSTKPSADPLLNAVEMVLEVVLDVSLFGVDRKGSEWVAAGDAVTGSVAGDTFKQVECVCAYIGVVGA